MARGKLSRLCAPSDEVAIEPNYCPEAINDYCSHISNCKPFALKAKQHLSAIGWSFYYILKGGGVRREIRYTAPNGRVFISLLRACKWCLESTASTDAVGDIDKKRKPDSDPNLEPLPRFSKRGRKLKKRSNHKKPIRSMVSSSSSCHQTPRAVLSWLIDNGVVLPRAKVEYRDKNGLAMAEGRICRKGIKCDCCGEIFTLTKFEAHAGSTKHWPLANIFLEDGRSLLECHSEMKQRKGETKGQGKSGKSKDVRKTSDNKTSDDDMCDDMCSVCHYGGLLILCDQCSALFHTQCLGLNEVPDGDWFCPSCSCRVCGIGKTDDCSVFTCCQCESRYHDECLRIKEVSKRYPEGYWFCQDTCEKIYRGLRKILGKPVQVGGTGSLTWRLLKYVKPDDSNDQYASSDDEFLSESYGKLTGALDVMHECFEPIKQPGTGSDLAEDVVFSNCSGLNFRGFYTVVLEKNDEMISAATVRIYGKRVAEVPLVATRFRYRRLGMCRVLMNELEKKLVDLGVERLVLPAVPSLLDTWTNSFGFSVMNESERLKFLDCTFLDFQGTIICQKFLTSNR